MNVKELLQRGVEEVLSENCGKRLNDAQRGAYDRVLKQLREGRVKGIISLPTGTGKTLLAACLLRNFFKLGKVKEGEHALYRPQNPDLP